MDYVVLARKLRPQRFQDLVGQDLVGRALRNAVRTGRLAHAYLFAGSRGIGKTSTARILTKAFNCLDLQDGEPCNACENCREIGANASPDVYEIDAASNRGIDNIRELRENTRYAPAKCRYKTYIVDEVHMLTPESFNALLKTLEEPPPHVKFILATTHPHRIPETILSRCQRFDFARIPLGLMLAYLERATAAEGLKIPRAALQSIARNSAGGMRDALTAVDQVVAFAGPAPTEEEVLGLLSLLDQGEVQALLEAILGRSLDGALETFRRMVACGHDLHAVLAALLREVKDLTLFGVLGRDNAYFADHLPETLDLYARLKDRAGADELQQIFQVLLELEGQLRSSGHAQACFDMALVKACRVQPLVGVPELLARAREALRALPGAGLVRPEAARAPEFRTPAVRPGAAPPTLTPPAPTRPPVKPPMPAQPAAARSGPAQGSAGAARPRSAAQPVATQSGDPQPQPGEDPEPARPPDAGLSAGTATVAAGAADAGPQPPEDLSADVPIPAAEPDEGDEPGALAPCDDPRWAALVQAVSSAGRLLGARLRDADVQRIEGDTVEAALRGQPLAGADLALVLAEGQRAFGPAFRLQWRDATSGQYRARRSVAGRKLWRDERARARQRAEAEADPAVQQVRRAFPNSKIVRVKLADPAAPPRTPDAS